MLAFIDDNKEKHEVESICKELPIAPSTYYDHKVKQRQPDKRSSRAKRDDDLKIDIQRVWDENFCVYGVRKVWCGMQDRQLPLLMSDVRVLALYI